MKTTLRWMVALALPALMAPEARAQWNVASVGARNRVYTTVGVDPAVVTSVGYVRTVPVGGHLWQLGVEGGLVTARLDSRDFRSRVQLRTTILGTGALRLVGSAAFVARGTENSIHRAFNFGSDFTGAAGLYRPHWFVAGEFGFDKAIITHLRHTDWYRTWFYPDAKDGWFLNAGGTFHYGATAGVTVGPAEVALRAGLRRTENFKEVTPPVYAGLGLGFRF